MGMEHLGKNEPDFKSEGIPANNDEEVLLQQKALSRVFSMVNKDLYKKEEYKSKDGEDRIRIKDLNNKIVYDDLRDGYLEYLQDHSIVKMNEPTFFKEDSLGNDLIGH